MYLYNIKKCYIYQYYMLTYNMKRYIIRVSKVIHTTEERRIHMDLHRYDIIEAELKIKDDSGSIQKKKRPYVIVSNESGTKNATIITVMPLTHVIKKTYLPVHECLEAHSNNGLSVYSMILGEQPQTICKEEVIRKLGRVTNKRQKNMINKVCFNTFFFGEDIDWKEVLA